MDSHNLQNMKPANNGSARMRFDNLDGLRAISCLAIIGYHVKKWTDMPLGGIGGRIVSTLTQFVPLFLILSGFGMCELPR